MGEGTLLRSRRRKRRYSGGGGNVETIKGECFAKAHISTAETTPREDTRVPCPHEDQGWPQSTCGTPQEGTSSPHARVVAAGPPRVLRFRAKHGWCAAAISTASIAPGSASRVPTSPSLFV